MADNIQDDLDTILGTRSRVKAAPQAQDAIDKELEGIVLSEPKGKTKKSGPSAEDWGPWLNTLDALLLGQERSLVPTPPKAPGAVVARQPENLSKDQAAVLKRHNALQEVGAAKHAWEQANPGLAAITSIAGSLPTTLTGAGLIKRGVEAPLMATKMAPAINYLAGRGGVGAPGVLGALERAGSRTTAGVLSGGGNALLTSGISDRPVSEQVATGAALGGVAGPVMGAVANKFGSHVTPEEATIAKNVIDQGVNLRPGQLPGAAPIVKLLDKMFSKDKKQTEDFTVALSKTMGENTPKISQATITEARKRIGDVLNNAAAGSYIPHTDQAFGQQLKDLVTRAHVELPSDEFAKKFAPIIQRINNEMLTGGISGDVYKSITQTGSALSTALERKSPIRYWAVQTKRALDEALERANPQAAAEIRAARHQWHNSVILDDLYDEASGKVDPTKLQKIIEREYGSSANASSRATKTGQDSDIGKLALGGQMMGPPKEGEPGFWKKAFAGSLPIAGGVGIADTLHGNSIIPQLLSDPSKATVLGLGAAGGYAAGKGTNALLNNPIYMDRLLSKATGQPPKLLINRLTQPPINPAVPAIQQGYETLNRAGEERRTPEGYPYIQQ